VEFPDRLIGNPQHVEIIVAQHHDIAELAFFDGAQISLLLQEPAVRDGVEADSFFTGNLLAAID